MLRHKLTMLVVDLLLIGSMLATVQLNAQPLSNHVQFDGLNDYISLNNMDVSGSAITLEALVNSSDLSNCNNNQCRIISKTTGTAAADHYWMLTTSDEGGTNVLRFRLKTNGTTTTLIANTGPMVDNTWYHVAATYDGTAMKLFLDGTEVGSTAKTGSLTTSPAVEAWIGGNPPLANGHPWKGGIDEVRIWNIARSQAALQTNMNIELSGNEAGLQAYYQFNEGSGQTINDSAGNNNTVLGSTNGTDVNDPTFAINNPQQQVTVNLTVLLEGPYDPSQTAMSGELLFRGVVPQGQPYSDSPWNYPGTEGNGWLPADYPVETVDWVLISLRETSDPITEVARAAAVLLKDGTISPFDIDLNGATNPLYIMVEHRNHLPILSAQPIPVVNNTLSYDFTLQNSYSPTGFGQKQVDNNWMMYAGNADQVGQNSCDINAADRIFWQSVNGLFDVYNPGDYDLDGDINAADRIIYNDNNGIFSTIPKSTDTTGGGGGGTDYATILANAPNWMCLTTAHEYLGEFLRQNPDVSYWNQDHALESIVSVAEPVITGTIVNITPTGANDNQLIENAATQAGQGGAVDGGGATFLINDLRINKAGVTLRNMTLKPSVNTAYRGLLVSAPDVTFLRVHLDMENKQYRSCLEANDNADRFAFVESSIKNFYNNSGLSGSMLRLYEGLDDAYIVNSEFVHGIGGPITGNSSVRGIRVASTNIGVTPKGGIIASNLFEDLQAAGQGSDADGMVFQGFDLDNQYQMGNRLAILANVGINSGKRLIKAQSGGLNVHSNVNHWKDLNGELGVRVTRCHYDSHGVSNLSWTNNLGITDHSNPGSESFFIQIQTHTFATDLIADNIDVSCNKYIHNDNTAGGRASYSFVTMDFNKATNGYAWPINSSFKDNIVEGSGTLKFVWWFKFGNDPLGTQFDHLQNQIQVNYEALYRP